jgi:hypothetical protein
MSYKKVTLGVQIIALLLLIQAANSFKKQFLMHDLQGTIEAVFCGGCQMSS